MGDAAITNWNSKLQNTPNLLAIYVFQILQSFNFFFEGLGQQTKQLVYLVALDK